MLNKNKNTEEKKRTHRGQLEELLLEDDELLEELLLEEDGLLEDDGLLEVADRTMSVLGWCENNT